MYDGLAQIEATYGCVAEYYRQMEEDAYEDYTPSDEELMMNHANSEAYDEQIRILNGSPSDFALSLKKEWDSKTPEYSDTWTMADVYASHEYGRNKLFDIASRLCAYYGIKHDDSMCLYSMDGKGEFGISVEYYDDPYIKAWDVTGLDYESFKNLFRDLYATGFHPTMKYVNDKGESRIVSNSCLGELRIYELKMYGVESEENITAELKEAGFDKADFISKILDELKRDKGLTVPLNANLEDAVLD